MPLAALSGRCALEVLIAFVALLTVVILVWELVLPMFVPPDGGKRRRVH